MSSDVDVTFPADGVKVSKSEMRAQFLTISNEITALQQRTGVAGAMAFNNYVTPDEVRLEIKRQLKSSGLPSDIAYGRVSL